MDAKQADAATARMRGVFRDGANALGAIHAALETPKRIHALESEVMGLRRACYRMAYALFATWTLGGLLVLAFGLVLHHAAIL